MLPVDSQSVELGRENEFSGTEMSEKMPTVLMRKIVRFQPSLDSTATAMSNLVKYQDE
jgi:hypothetical protein